MKTIKFLIISLVALSCSSNNEETQVVAEEKGIKGSELIDISGNKYKTVIINGKQWMAQNLNVDRYRNGDPIPHVQNASQWIKLTTGAYCNYENNTANGTVYGKLYNFYAVKDPRGLAPVGYHIPTETERNSLINSFGGQIKAGGALKGVGTTYWNSPNTGATNESGFNGLPGGLRISTNGNFQGLNKDAGFWTSTSIPSTLAVAMYFSHNNEGSSLGNVGNVKYGLSVRCLKD
jgi:uncharacterized protein (TIGR02145 family)